MEHVPDFVGSARHHSALRRRPLWHHNGPAHSPAADQPARGRATAFSATACVQSSRESIPADTEKSPARGVAFPGRAARVRRALTPRPAVPGRAGPPQVHSPQNQFWADLVAQGYSIAGNLHWQGGRPAEGVG